MVEEAENLAFIFLVTRTQVTPLTSLEQIVCHTEIKGCEIHAVNEWDLCCLLLGGRREQWLPCQWKEGWHRYLLSKRPSYGRYRQLFARISFFHVSGALAACLNGTFQPSFQLRGYVSTFCTVDYELNDRCYFYILPSLWSDGISMAMARVILEASYGKWQSGPQPAWRKATPASQSSEPSSFSAFFSSKKIMGVLRRGRGRAQSKDSYVCA